jgi:hypothetical protein
MSKFEVKKDLGRALRKVENSGNYLCGYNGCHTELVEA